MKLKQAEKIKPSDYDDPVSAPEVAVETKSSNITCSYGIHRGKFPVAGLKGREIRTVLNKLGMNIDKSAAMVIAGAVVDDETVVSIEVTMVSFVKPSAVKGAVAAETIEIIDRQVRMNGQKLDVDRFCGLVAQHTVSGLSDKPIPDNVKWIVRAGPLEVYIIELKPELRSINWDNEGDGKYKKRKLATPYIVIAAAFVNGQLHRNLELYYRTRPLTSLSDKLYHCNLLNISLGRVVEGHAGFKTWVCTQYLDLKKVKGVEDTLSEVISHIFGGGFNRSSDRSEGASGFSVYEAKCQDSRVNNVTNWQAESEKDPRFVLEVDWIDAKATPMDLINFRMNEFKVAQAPATSKALGNILLKVMTDAKQQEIPF